MTRRVLAVERSPLARNIYYMILSKLAEIEMLPVAVSAPMEEIESEIAGVDLLIISQTTLNDRKKEFYQMLQRVFKEKVIPCVVFVKPGLRQSWKDFADLGKVEIVERPFFPDDLLGVVGKWWRPK